jgi:hypothetical protein
MAEYCLTVLLDLGSIRCVLQPLASNWLQRRCYGDLNLIFWPIIILVTFEKIALNLQKFGKWPTRMFGHVVAFTCQRIIHMNEISCRVIIKLHVHVHVRVHVNWYGSRFLVAKLRFFIISYHIITRRRNPVGFLAEVWSPLQATLHLCGIFYLPWHRRSGTRDHGF